MLMPPSTNVAGSPRPMSSNAVGRKKGGAAVEARTTCHSFRCALANPLERLLSVGGLLDPVPLVLEDHPQAFTNRLLVVDDEDCCTVAFSRCGHEGEVYTRRTGQSPAREMACRPHTARADPF